MRILVLGGTVFLGRAVIDSALASGHSVTTFNRGKSGVDDARVDVVRGDRTVAADLGRLAEAGPWDAVIDTSPQVPRDMLASARSVEPLVRRYVVVSSVSVYRDWPDEPMTAGSALFACPTDAGPDDGHYGELKAGCEAAAVSVLGERAVLVRPGIILGPHENVGRLPWWLTRIARGGRVPVPRPDGPLQLVDVRDLADLLVRLATASEPASSPVVAVGPVGRDTHGDLVRCAMDATGSAADRVELPDDFLVARGIGVWSELPLWTPVPVAGEPATHHWDVDPSSAVAAGLQSRPLAQTVSDTWDWLKDSPVQPARPEIGLDPQREAELLAAWDARVS